ncbi:hypothetical protein BASA83_008642 [Batrachochytrium salamandrivorans]|nr:hypothetical protein BASA83_008642 [Batrachochytrium salamandrivorans]
MQVVSNTPLHSDFHKPHRKALMGTVLGKDSHCSQTKARKIIVAAQALAPIATSTAQGMGDALLGVDLHTHQHCSNAVAAAMDHPFVANSKTYLVRPPIKVPDNYLARLKDVEPIRRNLMNQITPPVTIPNVPFCGLKFDEIVLDEMASDRQESLPRRLAKDPRKMVKGQEGKAIPSYKSKARKAQSDLSIDAAISLEGSNASTLSSPASLHRSFNSQQNPLYKGHVDPLDDHDRHTICPRITNQAESMLKHESPFTSADSKINITTLESTLTTAHRRDSHILLPKDGLLGSGSIVGPQSILSSARLSKTSLYNHRRSIVADHEHVHIRRRASTSSQLENVNACNLAYMLMIWKRAEGADFESMYGNASPSYPEACATGALRRLSILKEPNAKPAIPRNGGFDIFENTSPDAREDPAIKRIAKPAVGLDDDPYLVDPNLDSHLGSFLTLPSEDELLFFGTNNFGEQLLNNNSSIHVLPRVDEDDAQVPTSYHRHAIHKVPLDPLNETWGSSHEIHSDPMVLESMNSGTLLGYARHGHQRLPNPDTISTPNSNLPNGDSMMNSTGRVASKQQQSTGFLETQTHSCHDQQDAHTHGTFNGNATLSHSTLRFLKRLCRENQLSQEKSEDISNGTDANVLLRTLTGKSTNSESPDDPFTIDPDAKLNLNVSDLSSASNSHQKKIPVTPLKTNKPLSRQTHISKRIWLNLVNQIIDSGEDDPIPKLNSETLGLNVNVNPDLLSLRLSEYDIDDLSTEAGSVSDDQPRANRTHGASHRAATPSIFDKPQCGNIALADVSDFNLCSIKGRSTTDEFSSYLQGVSEKLSNSSRKSSTFKPIKLQSSLDRMYVNQAPQPPPQFSLERFIALAKHNTQNHVVGKKFNDHPIKNLHEKETLMNSLVEFLGSSFSGLKTIPQPGTIEREAVIKILTIALREENDCLLQFEACRLLIHIQAQGNLTRWDVITFKRVLDNMLKSGSEEERDAAALAFIESNSINTVVIGQIRSALGNLNQGRRDMAREVLAHLDLMHAEMIVQVLVDDSKHINWRVRLDVIHLLEIWIRRLSPVYTSSISARDPGTPDTDDTASRMQSQHVNSHYEINPHDSVASSNSHSKDENTPHLPRFFQGSASFQEPLGISLKSSLETLPVRLSPKIIERRRVVVKSCVDVLLGLMWGDWSQDVRKAASGSLSGLGQDLQVFEWVISLLSSDDPIKRVDALCHLAYLKVMTKSSLHLYLACFKDPYASVRIEACKVACVLASADCGIIDALLDLLDEHDYRVRAYAIKALGYSGSKELKNRETLTWALYHDPHEVVRAEAIQAVARLDLVTKDKTIKEAVLTLLKTDKSENVKKEAEKALFAYGSIFSNLVDTDTPAVDERSEVLEVPYTIGVDGLKVPAIETGPLLSADLQVGPIESSTVDTTRLKAYTTIPYPHILSDASPKEIDIFLRDSLIGEAELQIAGGKIRDITTKESIMADVQYVLKTSGISNRVENDLISNREFTPQIRRVYQKKRR